MTSKVIDNRNGRNNNKTNKLNLEIILEKVVMDIWSKDNTFIELDNAKQSGGKVLKNLTLSLPDNFVGADPTNSPIQNVFAWGTFGHKTDKVKRHETELIRDIEKPIKMGFCQNYWNGSGGRTKNAMSRQGMAKPTGASIHNGEIWWRHRFQSISPIMVADTAAIFRRINSSSHRFIPVYHDISGTRLKFASTGKTNMSIYKQNVKHSYLILQWITEKGSTEFRPRQIIFKTKFEIKK